jgi:hypothetical protein
MIGLPVGSLFRAAQQCGHEWGWPGASRVDLSFLDNFFFRQLEDRQCKISQVEDGFVGKDRDNE